MSDQELLDKIDLYKERIINLTAGRKEGGEGPLVMNPPPVVVPEA